MSDTKKFTVSISPHVRSGDTVSGIMLDVIIALIPAIIAAIRFFGPRAALVIGVSVGSCVFFEFIWNKLLKKSGTIGDYSAIVTGLLLAMNLPVSIPLWMVLIGAAFSIIIVKQFFGGLGQNFVNPALSGRIMLLVSFPAAMTNFTELYTWGSKVDVISTATPLYRVYENFNGVEGAASLPTLTQIFLGQSTGCIGEVCSLGLLIGFIYLLSRRVISAIIPVSFVGTVAVITFIASKGDLNFMLYNLLGGGLLLGAIFMATDYTTSPISRGGKLVFGIGCGLVTAVIRLFGSLPEGVSYAIILMNVLNPLIDKACMPKPFGSKKEKKAKEAAAT